MALTTKDNWREYTGVAVADCSDALLDNLIDRASDAIEKYCHRTFASTAYRERYDGDGETNLFLNQYPITAVTMVSVGSHDAIRITNTSSDAFSAYVTVGEMGDLSTSLALVVVGGTNDGTSTLNFAARATYTLATLVTAINALGSGWAATLALTAEQYWDACEILPVMAYQCLDSYTYLSVPDDPKQGYEIYAKRGELLLSSRFSTGCQNVTVRYTAGYSTIPDDLEQICIDLVQVYYKSKGLDSTVKREKLDDHDITYADEGGGGARDLPQHIRRRLAPYKKWRVPA
ncbi:MAG: head-tail connector protein [Planctomycetota bacterium]|jgi:hypothetical protein